MIDIIKHIVPLIALFALSAHAETVSVKYRGQVDLASFSCQSTKSSLVYRLCYDTKKQYAVVNLKGTYYHYCAVPSGVIRSWLSSDSLGRFYNANIKGNYDCRRQ